MDGGLYFISPMTVNKYDVYIVEFWNNDFIVFQIALKTKFAMMSSMTKSRPYENYHLSLNVSAHQ